MRLHVATAIVALAALCTVAGGQQQCVEPARRVVDEQCDRTRTLSGGLAGTRWAYDWRAGRCVRVALRCDDAVWTLFDTKRQCMAACGRSVPPAGASGKDDRWLPPASIYATTQHATPPPTTTKPHRICNTLVDLVIMLDSSGSIEDKRYGAWACADCFNSVMKKFTKEIIGRRDTCSAAGGGSAYKAMQFSVWRFGNAIGGQCDGPDEHDIKKGYDPYDGFGLDEAADMDNAQVIALVDKIKWNNAYSFVVQGFKCARKTLAASKRRNDAAVKRIVVLITDGGAAYPSHAQAAADALRRDGTSVIVVVFGTDKHKQEMIGYAGGRAELAFDLREARPLDYLNDIVSRIQICYHCLKDFPHVATCDHQLCVDRYG